MKKINSASSSCFGHFGGAKSRILDFSKLFRRYLGSVWVLVSTLKGPYFWVYFKHQRLTNDDRNIVIFYQKFSAFLRF